MLFNDAARVSAEWTAAHPRRAPPHCAPGTAEGPAARHAGDRDLPRHAVRRGSLRLRRPRRVARGRGRVGQNLPVRPHARACDLCDGAGTRHGIRRRGGRAASAAGRPGADQRRDRSASRATATRARPMGFSMTSAARSGCAACRTTSQRRRPASFRRSCRSGSRCGSSAGSSYAGAAFRFSRSSRRRSSAA